MVHKKTNRKEREAPKENQLKTLAYFAIPKERANNGRH
jgi:hypothetical protein